jgi:hypothetical protein
MKKANLEKLCAALIAAGYREAFPLGVMPTRQDVVVTCENDAAFEADRAGEPRFVAVAKANGMTFAEVRLSAPRFVLGDVRAKE